MEPTFSSFDIRLGSEYNIGPRASVKITAIAQNEESVLNYCIFTQIKGYTRIYIGYLFVWYLPKCILKLAMRCERNLKYTVLNQYA